MMIMCFATDISHPKTWTCWNIQSCSGTHAKRKKKRKKKPMATKTTACQWQLLHAHTKLNYILLKRDIIMAFVSPHPSPSPIPHKIKGEISTHIKHEEKWIKKWRTQSLTGDPTGIGDGCVKPHWNIGSPMGVVWHMWVKHSVFLLREACGCWIASSLVKPALGYNTNLLIDIKQHLMILLFAFFPQCGPAQCLPCCYAMHEIAVSSLAKINVISDLWHHVSSK